MDLQTIIITGITGLLSGGVGVALTKGFFSVKLRKIDQHDQLLDKLNEQYKDVWNRYTRLQEEYAELKGKAVSQENEIELLKRRLKEFSGYKSQALKLNRLTKALNEYYKTNQITALIKSMEKELL